MRVLVCTMVLALVSLATTGSADAVDRKRRRPGPLRVLLVGDSITMNYSGLAATALAAKGYEVIQFGVGGSSILDADACKGHRARILLNAFDPDVVVYQNTGNYHRPCPPQVAYASKQFYRQWKAAARVNQRILISKGARFFWILNPAVRHPVVTPAVPQINAIFRAVGATKPANVKLIDAWTPFGGATFNPALHVADGIHLSPAGAQTMANLVVAAVG